MSKPKFQARHYEALAATFKKAIAVDCPNPSLLRGYGRDFALAFADTLEADNAKFDRLRFLKACGVA